MGRMQDRADRLVRRIFNKPARPGARPESVVSLQDNLRKRREKVLKTRRGL